MHNTYPNMAIVITTFKRQELLERLLQSIRQLDVQPAGIVLVDNECSKETEDIARRFGVEHYIGMPENTGGAGGFSRGVHEAYERGYDWMWLMDDDVEMLDRAIEKLTPWLEKTERELKNGTPIENCVCAFQPFRRNYDGSFFFWQYRFIEKMGIQNPFAKAHFDEGEAAKDANAICFEGGIIHRRAVEAIGLPDARFFIYWDDTVYGYLISKTSRILLIPEYCLQRTRELSNMRVGKTRKLNTTSDMARFYIMRNRGHMAHYLKENGDYSPFLFSLGTAYTWLKECIRLFVGKSCDKKESIKTLKRGAKEARRIRRDTSWQPYREVEKL